MASGDKTDVEPTCCYKSSAVFYLPLERQTDAAHKNKAFQAHRHTSRQFSTYLNCDLMKTRRSSHLPLFLLLMSDVFMMHM